MLHIEDLDAELLWQFYQRGCASLMRSGLFFQQALRPPLSHVHFQRAIPLLQDYARSLHNHTDLPFTFHEDLARNPLTRRDLIHLEYAIGLGYSEVLGGSFPIPPGLSMFEMEDTFVDTEIFIAADRAYQEAEMLAELEREEELDELFEDEDEDEDGDDSSEPPFDL